MALLLLIGQSDAAKTKATTGLAAVDDDDNDLGEDFLFDLASRFNEGLTANLDSLDRALLAIAGGVLAISALAIDKSNRSNADLDSGQYLH